MAKARTFPTGTPNSLVCCKIHLEEILRPWWYSKHIVQPFKWKCNKISAHTEISSRSSPCQCANIGPADYNYDETISTLRYANRAKNIKNKARINEDPKDALLRQFQKEIEELKKKLEEGSEPDVIININIGI